MPHLSIETLARLVDEAPVTEEAAHLELCAECRTELEGLKADAAALSSLPDIEPPAANWFAIEHRLAGEGMLRPSAQRAAHRWSMPLLQTAAAIAIFVIGNYTAPLINRTSNSGDTDNSSNVGNSANVANAPARLANNVSAPAATADAAAAAVREAEGVYLSALTRYAELAGQAEPVDPLARLAALESIVMTTRTALGRAPADPVINGYHLTALAQRDATLKRMASNTAKQTWF